MSNIDKQAVTAKTKELASFMVERFSMNPVSCKLLNEAWKKEFPDEVAIAERMLALLDENIQLQREKDAIEAVALARIALAALNDEPVAYNQVQRDMMKDIIVRKLGGNLLGHKLMMADIHAVTMALIQAGFRTAQPASERERIRHEHAEWSYADPVVFTDERNLHHIARGRETSLIWGKQNQEVGDIPLYRHAQPVPVDKEFIPKNLDKALGVVGVALPESKEEFNFQTERWIQRLIDRVIRYADEFKEQTAPVVPEEMNFSTACNFVQINGMAKEDRATLAMRAWNACRAAMLQGAEPVSQTYELPELIEGMEVSIDISTCDADAGHRYFGTVTEVSELDTAKNGYILLVQDAKPNFDVNGNSPVIPGGWISCSERMPDNDESKPIAIFTGKCLGQGMFVATYDDDGFFDYWEGMEIIGVSHWMPLPAPPQQ